MIKNCSLLPLSIKLLSSSSSHINGEKSRYFHFSADMPRPSVCVSVRVHTCEHAGGEVLVHVFSRPLSTSGSCYSPCDLCVVVLHPSPHRSSVGEQSNDWVLLQFPGPLAIWVFTPLLQAGDGLLWTIFFPSLSSEWCLFSFLSLFFLKEECSEASGCFIITFMSSW